MTRRFAARRTHDRERSGVIDFDCALQDYLAGGGAEQLLRAAGMVLGSSIPLDEKRAEAIAALTGCNCEFADYDDAGRAVRRWFALVAEPGARH